MISPQQKITGLGSMKIFDKVHPFQVNSLSHQEMFTQTLGIKLNDYEAALGEMLSVEGMRSTKLTLVFVWSALYAGALRTTKKAPDFDYYDVQNQVEDTYNDVEEGYEQRQQDLQNELLKPFQLQGEMFAAKKKAEDNKLSQQA